MPRHACPAVLLVALLFPIACARSDAPEGETAQPTTDAGERTPPFTISGVGFETPESVLHDEQADVYLVSNINGAPTGRDDNGFVSRVRPDGTVESLRWIDGARPEVTLHAPKGLALIGDTLFVSDIDSVRAFHRTTGAPLGARGVPGAAFLNDLAAGPDGALYVSDTGVDASFASIGKEAIYVFREGNASPVARGAQLMGPNGIQVDNDAVYVAAFGGNSVSRYPLGGGSPTAHTLPHGQLDGLLRLSDGTLLVTSWEAKAVYRIAPDGQISTVVENVESPADMGRDARRNRLLIPLFMGNSVEVR